MLRFFKGQRGLPSVAAVFFIFCILLVFNFSNWRMMKLLQESKEEDLVRRLRGVSLILVNALKSPEPPSILKETATRPAEQENALLDAFADSDEADELAFRLQSLGKDSGLAQVILLSVHGTVIADKDFRFSVGEPLPFSIDKSHFEQAKASGEATTNLYDWGDQKFQRQYKLITGENGAAAGVLMCSISADHVQSIDQVRGEVYRLWFLSSLLMLFLVYWLWRVFYYTLRLERKATQATRVESMGALAAGVAHELRNPLAIIRVLAEEIRTDHKPDTTEARNAQDIIQETQRLGELINHFLSLSRPPEREQGVPLDITHEIRRVAELMRKSADGRYEIRLDLPEKPLFVTGEERALRQILLNILVNSQEAIPKPGGLIQIILREKRHKWAELRIEDNGKGIPAKELSRVFEPFFTTKQDGTGLGLAISRGIAENFGGSLRLESHGGRGAVAILELPLEQSGGRGAK